MGAWGKGVGAREYARGGVEGWRSSHYLVEFINGAQSLGVCVREGVCMCVHVCEKPNPKS